MKLPSTETVPVADQPRITTYDPFKDGFAHRLKLSLRAMGRHGSLLDTVVPEEKTGLPGASVATTAVLSSGADEQGRVGLSFVA